MYTWIPTSILNYAYQSVTRVPPSSSIRPEYVPVSPVSPISQDPESSDPSDPLTIGPSDAQYVRRSGSDSLFPLFSVVRRVGRSPERSARNHCNRKRSAYTGARTRDPLVMYDKA